MGCIESRGDDGNKRRITLDSLIRRLRRNNKVAPFTDNTARVAVNTGTPMLNLTRKTEQMVMQQLWAQGIIPKRREGGVEFIIEMGDNKPKRSSVSFSAATLPGVPQYSTAEKSLPVILPPISRVAKMMAIEEKMDKAKLNREMKIQERKAKAAKTIEKARKRRECVLN
ncbi:uncharacterized protein LOC132549588 [Ylistrum balloti]|uniref:uncharacterized protein LOC132549588 n=1 Tax=Ylistrum balloti TaxID=509963 RepID=UPI0029058727|nr:uncharacterized protein LOC132549588 [Ylistrum balloti]